ncbi:glutamate receptor ionotropic, kainate glr-3-like [Procambarus clarkii]|uniref:glutamate receptor ionotropic, kainate glr-3-like n=1 Tax=Procambarus clarkii TaxID=6728 RepID=UPI001E6714A7|nr:glutamate receptor ionotropic, kainate glr-3-like [Procambarus clarkii]
MTSYSLVIVTALMYMTKELMVVDALGNSTIYTEDDEELASLMELLAEQYAPRCLRVVVGDARLWNGNWGRDHVIINPNNYIEAQNTIEFIKENLLSVTTYSCVVYMAPHPLLLRPQLLAAITDLSKKHINRYIVARAASVTHASEFLLDKRLSQEEHVAALVKKTGRRGSWWQVLNRQLYHHSGSPEVQQITTWSKGRVLHTRRKLFPEQMANFYGLRMVGVTLDFRPFTDFEVNPGSRRVKARPSLDIFILNEIARKLNFTYDLVMPVDGLWGFLKDDGHWTGVVGEVESGRANFSLVLSVTFERTRIVDFTRMYYLDPLSFVTAKSRHQPPWLKLITPFSGQVWVVSSASVVVAVVLYWVIFRAQAVFGSSVVTPSRAFIYIFGAFLGQPLPRMAWFSAGKVLLGFWLVYSFLVTSYYKTSLTATLAAPSIPPTIDTLHQLLRSNLKFGMIDAKGSEFQLFSTSNVTLYQKMFKEMSFYSSSESMQRVAAGHYAYIYFKSNLETIVSTKFTSLGGKTDLHVASENFFPGGYGWAFPKGAPYGRMFDKVMWRCVQAGLIDKWLKDLYTIYLEETMNQKTPQERLEEKEAASAKSNNDVVLNLDHLQGAFFSLLLGTAAGVLLLLMECVFSRFLSSVALTSNCPLGQSHASGSIMKPIVLMCRR